MEQDWHLVYLEHDIREEELVAILRFLVMITAIALLLTCLLLSLPASSMQIDPGAQCVVISLDLPNGFIQEGMEAR